MPWFDFACKTCGKEFQDETETPNHGVLCECGAIAELVWKKFPGVCFKNWKPEPGTMDLERELQEADDYFSNDRHRTDL